MRKTIIRSVLAFTVGSALILSLSSCTAEGLAPVQEKGIRNFYTSYIKEATSLNNDKINAAYSDLKKQNLTGVDTNTARDTIFNRFAEVNPKFFDDYAVQYATYDEVGATYTSVLLMSLTTKGVAVSPDFPSDAISKKYDNKLKTTVYEIDRSKITAPVPLAAESLVTPVSKGSLKPIKLVQVKGEWKIVPDAESLQEIGIPDGIKK
jgi:hypothetical protein